MLFAVHPNCSLFACVNAMPCHALLLAKPSFTMGEEECDFVASVFIASIAHHEIGPKNYTSLHPEILCRSETFDFGA